MLNLVSISEAAKHLGIQRPTLSRIIKEHKIETKQQGKRKLVHIIECQKIVQKLASEGKLRHRTVKKTSNENDNWKELYLEMKRERESFQEKCRALESENIELRGELKLLKPANEERKKIENKTKNIFHKLGNAWDVITA